jgi:hypothetical protein
VRLETRPDGPPNWQLGPPSEEPPTILAKIQSDMLNFDDFAVAVGARPDTQPGKSHPRGRRTKRRRGPQTRVSCPTALSHYQMVLKVGFTVED